MHVEYRKTIADTVVRPVARAVTGGGEDGNGSGINAAPKNLLIFISVLIFLKQALY